MSPRNPPKPRRAHAEPEESRRAGRRERLTRMAAMNAPAAIRRSSSPPARLPTHPTTELEYASPSSCWSRWCCRRRPPTRRQQATRKLFALAPRPRPMALGEDGIADIKTIGLFRNKAKNVIALPRLLLERHGGEVPADRERSKPCPASGARPPTWCSTPPSASRRWRSTPTSSASPTAPASPRQDVLEVEKRCCGACPEGLPARRPPLADPARPLRASTTPWSRMSMRRWTFRPGRQINLPAPVAAPTWPSRSSRSTSRPASGTAFGPPASTAATATTPCTTRLGASARCPFDAQRKGTPRPDGAAYVGALRNRARAGL